MTVKNTGGSPTLTLNDGGTATALSAARHHRADLQLHGRGGTEHAGPDRTPPSISMARPSRTEPAMSPTCQPPPTTIRPARCRSARRQRQLPRSQAPAPKSRRQRRPERRPGRHADGQFQCGGQRRQHHRRHADAYPQRWRRCDRSRGSGTTALTFSYTVAAGQNTPDLIVSAFNLNGATVKDAEPATSPTCRAPPTTIRPARCRDRYDPTERELDRDLRHRNHQWQRQSGHQQGVTLTTTSARP